MDFKRKDRLLTDILVKIALISAHEGQDGRFSCSSLKADERASGMTLLQTFVMATQIRGEDPIQRIDYGTHYVCYLEKHPGWMRLVYPSLKCQLRAHTLTGLHTERQ